MQTVFGLVLLTGIAYGVFYLIIDSMMFQMADYEFYRSVKGEGIRFLASVVAALLFVLAALQVQ